MNGDFDAASSSTPNASVTVVLYTMGNNSMVTKGGPLLASITGSFPNGSLFGFDVPATEAVVDEPATDSLSVDYVGAGFNFTGTPLLDDGPVVYTIKLDVPDLGISGTLQLTSVDFTLSFSLFTSYSSNIPGATEVILPALGGPTRSQTRPPPCPSR